MMAGEVLPNEILVGVVDVWSVSRIKPDDPYLGCRR
jgi:hypothetical protein